MRLIYNCVALVLLVPLYSSMPADKTKENVLFYLQRSRDADEIHYQLNLNKDGSLLEDEPIEANWVRLSTDGHKEPISWLQKELSFGLKYLSLKDDQAKFQFACCDQMTFYLRKDFGTFSVYISEEDKLLQLKRVFLQYNGGTQWLPNVEYAELYLEDVKTKKEITERIYP